MVGFLSRVGAEGGIRTLTGRVPQGILSARRLPFRHPGTGYRLGHRGSTP